MYPGFYRAHFKNLSKADEDDDDDSTLIKVHDDKSVQRVNNGESN